MTFKLTFLGPLNPKFGDPYDMRGAEFVCLKQLRSKNSFFYPFKGCLPNGSGCQPWSWGPHPLACRKFILNFVSVVGLLPPSPSPAACKAAGMSGNLFKITKTIPDFLTAAKCAQ